MNRRSLRWGVTASGALAGFYVTVLALSGGWEHTATDNATGAAVLMIEGLDEPVTARWALPQGG